MLQLHQLLTLHLHHHGQPITKPTVGIQGTATFRPGKTGEVQFFFPGSQPRPFAWNRYLYLDRVSALSGQLGELSGESLQTPED